MRLYYFSIFIFFEFLKIACPSATFGLRFRNEHGKLIVMLVADRMLSFSNLKDFHNFEQEWRLQREEGEISAHEYNVRVDLLDANRRLTLKPAEYEAGMQGNPPKIVLAGHGREEIGIAFTGDGLTTAVFARKMKKKRDNPIRNRITYNSIDAVAYGMEKAHRKTLVQQYDTHDQGKIRHYGADARHLYGVTVGRTRRRGPGHRVSTEPKVRKLQGHLYSAGWNAEALRYLEPLFGPANQKHWREPPPPPQYRMADVKRHVVEAMRRNAEQSVRNGDFSVTENFDAYIFSPGEKAVYWDHEPEFGPHTRARLEGQVSPVETMKKLIRHDHWMTEDIPGRFELTAQQRGWKEIAMQELELEHKRELEMRGSRHRHDYNYYPAYYSPRHAGNKAKVQAGKNSPDRVEFGSTNGKRSKTPYMSTNRQRMRLRGKKNIGLRPPSKIPNKARSG